MNLQSEIEKLFGEAIKSAFPDQKINPMIAPSRNRSGEFHYQCNNAMGSKIKGKSPECVGQTIVENLPQSPMIEHCHVGERGFVNIKLSSIWMAKRIHEMLVDGIETWAPKPPVKRAVVDFSSPNIAKELHVGHLRSTIIGDTLARLLEFSGVEVLRRNHVGDWGTQFGMLIEYLLDKFHDGVPSDEQAIEELQANYRASKKKFDTNPVFKEKAQRAVVCLQAGEEKYRNSWAKICEISRKGFQKLYQRLGVELEEKGESFYNPFIPATLNLLHQKGLIENSEGASVIRMKGKEVPTMVVKSDGAYNYTTTDLAALWYRLNEEKAEWIIYVTGADQQGHFAMVFDAAERAGWLPGGDKYPKATHVGFGVVSGDDGKKFQTRSGETVKLADLLDEAKSRSKKALVERRLKSEELINAEEEEEIDASAEAIGYGAVKYADLKNNRTTNYTFSFDQMLNDRGNTAVYLQYAHVRLCSIIKRSGRDVDELKMVESEAAPVVLGHRDERVLGLCLLRFPETVEEACAKLLPSLLCEYVYRLAGDATQFYTNCQVVGSPEETSRVLLCQATALVMRKCFDLLGIVPVYKI